MVNNVNNAHQNNTFHCVRRVVGEEPHRLVVVCLCVCLCLTPRIPPPFPLLCVCASQASCTSAGWGRACTTAYPGS